MVPMARIERATSPLPRECSTTELHGHAVQATHGAGEGNRTLVVSLEGFCSTIELHPPATDLRPNRYIDRAAKSSFLSAIQNAPKKLQHHLVEGEGFEPSKAEPTDLQSAPFDRSGTPPNEAEHYRVLAFRCQLYI